MKSAQGEKNLSRMHNNWMYTIYDPMELSDEHLMRRYITLRQLYHSHSSMQQARDVIRLGDHDSNKEQMIASFKDEERKCGFIISTILQDIGWSWEMVQDGYVATALLMYNDEVKRRAKRDEQNPRRDTREENRSC